MKDTQNKRRSFAICMMIALLLCVSMLTACKGTSVLGMLDRINSKGATAGDAYYAASYGNAYAMPTPSAATAGNAIATAGNAVATSGNAVATSGNAVATAGNAVATSGNALTWRPTPTI